MDAEGESRTDGELDEVDVDAWMPMYVGDYLRDTQDLNTEEHGAYTLLIFNIWVRKGFLPYQPARLCRIAKVDPSRWPDVWDGISRFFRVENGEVRQKRVGEELDKARRKKLARQSAGRSGGVASGKARRGSNGEANAKQTRSKASADVEQTGTKPASKNEANTNPPPSPSPSPSEKGGGARAPAIPVAVVPAPAPANPPPPGPSGREEIRKPPQPARADPPIAERIMPDTPANLLHVMRVIAERLRPELGFWNPGRFADRDVADFFRPMSEAQRRAFAPALLKRVELFFEQPDEDGWPAKNFLDRVNTIGVMRAMPPTQPPRWSPSMEPR